MPELPEVEIVKRSLNKKIKGKISQYYKIGLAKLLNHFCTLMFCRTPKQFFSMILSLELATGMHKGHGR